MAVPKAFRELGAELAVTFLNDKAKPYVATLADELEAPIFIPMDADKPGELGGRFRTKHQ
jgi:enoyl-[acyl-carrier protein] reductase I